MEANSYTKPYRDYMPDNEPYAMAYLPPPNDPNKQDPYFPLDEPYIPGTWYPAYMSPDRDPYQIMSDNRYGNALKSSSSSSARTKRCRNTHLLKKARGANSVLNYGEFNGPGAAMLPDPNIPGPPQPRRIEPYQQKTKRMHFSDSFVPFQEPY